MTRLVRLAQQRLRHREGGFTLVEMIVASTLFLLISTLTFTIIMTGVRTMEESRLYNDLNEEARVVLNRMSRELREAEAITAASNPGGTGFVEAADGSITFEVDFDGDGVPEPDAPDPEKLTYRYNYAEQKLELVVSGTAYNVLAANVTKFKLEYTSSAAYKYDTNQDGTTTWQELDADATGTVGNGNGTLDYELDFIDSVTISLTVLKAPHQQTYRTTIDLRNKSSL